MPGPRGTGASDARTSKQPDCTRLQIAPQDPGSGSHGALSGGGAAHAGIMLLVLVTRTRARVTVPFPFSCPFSCSSLVARRSSLVARPRPRPRARARARPRSRPLEMQYGTDRDRSLAEVRSATLVLGADEAAGGADELLVEGSRQRDVERKRA